MSDRSPTAARILLPALAALAAGLVTGVLAGRRMAGDAPAAASTDESPVVARVGDDELTLGELDERWKQLDPPMQALHANAAAEAGLSGPREHFLGELVDEMLLAREARRRGLDARPDVRAAVQACRDRVITRPLLAQEVRGKAVPESELETYHRQASDRFGSPERVQLREIIVTSTPGGPGDDTADAAAARAKADALHARAAAGEDFAEIARSGSEAPSAQYGGLVGWVVAGRHARAWEEQALRLHAGEISPVIEIPEGFAILRADAREEATVPPLAEIRETLLEELLADDPGALRRRYSVFVAELRAKEKVELHPERLGQDASPVPPPPRASAPAESGSPGG